MGLARVNYDYICDHPAELKHEEDAVIIQPPFYGILDGFSEPHSYLNPPMLFNGFTGGEMIAKTAQKDFCGASPNLAIEDYLQLANAEIRKILATKGLSVDNAGLIPGAVFAIVKVKDKVIEIVRGGDCLIVWRFAYGHAGFSYNQAFGHVSLNLQTIKEILVRNNGNREEMWVEFAPILSKLRQNDINNPLSPQCYAVLNGQPSIIKCWERSEVSLRNLAIMLIFSNGFVHYEQTSPDKIGSLAAKLINDYVRKRTSGFSQKEALNQMLAQKRGKAIANAKFSYINRDEASAIALEFGKEERQAETADIFSMIRTKSLCPI